MIAPVTRRGAASTLTMRRAARVAIMVADRGARAPPGQQDLAAVPQLVGLAQDTALDAGLLPVEVYASPGRRRSRRGEDRQRDY